MQLIPHIPQALAEYAGSPLQWEALRERLAAGAMSSLGRDWIGALGPSADGAWIGAQQQRNAEMRGLVRVGAFDFRGVFDVREMVEQARIEGAALEAAELLRVLAHAERVEAWRQLVVAPPAEVRGKWAAMEALSAALVERELGGLLRALRGKIEPDGTLADDASHELRRIRRALAAQHRAIETSLRRALAKLSDDGSVQESLITVRGERFVIPVKAEFKRKVGGVIHGSSSTGQTFFVEPMETIEQNNELARLLDEEQAEVHRILVAMTRAVAVESETLLVGAGILAEADAHQGIARFAEEMDCVRPLLVAPTHDDEAIMNGAPEIAGDEWASRPHPFAKDAKGWATRKIEDAAEIAEFELVGARHPLLELRLRDAKIRESGPGAPGSAIVPLTIALPNGTRQMIVSGPNTGGKTVALKTAGLLAVMAQAGVPVPAERARLPLFTAIYADIGDAQSIEQNLSTFSAHVMNVDRISRVANERSLVLLDELGSATDPEEGAALAVAVAGHFLERRAWTLITTHLTSLKVYAAKHEGVLNAAVGFDEEKLAPTYDLRLGVPGASAGLNIAARLGMDAAIVADARAQMTTQQADIGRFLDELHAQLSAVTAERERLTAAEKQVAYERMRLEVEGKKEQQALTRALGRELEELIKEFEAQLRETVKAIDDKTAAAKIAKDSALRIARLKREFSEQFQATVATHTEAASPAAPQTDVAEVVAAAKAVVRGGGVSVAGAGLDDTTYLSSEINVIGRTADEAEAEVDRFIERSFLAGLPRVRVVHGVGMGILRRTLREFLRNHPHVTGVTEPPYNEGGQGATIVELRQ